MTDDEARAQLVDYLLARAAAKARRPLVDLLTPPGRDNAPRPQHPKNRP